MCRLLLLLLEGRGGFVEGDESGRMGAWLAVWPSGDRGAGGSWMEASCVRSALDVEDLGDSVGAVWIGGEVALSAAGSAAAFPSGGTTVACVLDSVGWRLVSGFAALSGFAESFVARCWVAFWPPLFRLDAGIALKAKNAG